MRQEDAETGRKAAVVRLNPETTLLLPDWHPRRFLSGWCVWRMTMPPTRRSFVMAPVLLAARRLAGADPALRFPAAPRDRLAIASYSLRTLLDSPRNRARGGTSDLIDIKDFPAFAVKRFNVRNLE